MKVLIGVSEFEKGVGEGTFVYKFVNKIKKMLFFMIYLVEGFKRRDSKLSFALAHALGYSTSWSPALELF